MKKSITEAVLWASVLLLSLSTVDAKENELFGLDPKPPIFSLDVADSGYLALWEPQNIFTKNIQMSAMDNFDKSLHWERNRFDVQFRCDEQGTNDTWLLPMIEEPQTCAAVDSFGSSKCNTNLQYTDLFEDIGAQLTLAPLQFESIEEARLAAASRLPHEATKEAGFILYELADGSVGISDQLPGSGHSLDPFSLTRQGEQTMTAKGYHGIDGHYPVLEILHSHPPHSNHMHSGGAGKGDVYIAESLGVSVSVVHDGEIRLYIPTGRNLKTTFQRTSGELVALLNTSDVETL
ncbi:hypothetical protein QWI17_16800 [Gilvimarinus sp. SDUM040013]|uniref:Uncharacterized protein n=1 Tax=Gilvimarinus gilvus TaxID=3058038 RepID=A0ABU4S2E9_9GAMM|nr:hypothetical protein [Gilvimarinus sp. SDUM040013]MDO3387504.1 hypothetical protein [Gilvimarinus sp. SDUM040013]MDX6851350.1 hypothetical protein [Gilvimarinus sp. SDUM040013]